PCFGENLPTVLQCATEVDWIFVLCLWLHFDNGSPITIERNPENLALHNSPILATAGDGLRNCSIRQNSQLWPGEIDYELSPLRIPGISSDASGDHFILGQFSISLPRPIKRVTKAKWL